MKKTMTIILVAAVALFCIPACNGESDRLPGDLNADGHLTSLDIALIENLIEQGSNNQAGDLNNDGNVDENDLDELKNGVCESNGAQQNDLGNCCYTNSNTVCCDTNYDGDFNECTPPIVDCNNDTECNHVNCPAFCNATNRCQCINACDDDADCMPMNCPAFCNQNGGCECKIPCNRNDDCAFLSKCQAQCNTAGFCECSVDECAGEGERIFGPLDGNQIRCCPGLEPIECLGTSNDSQGNNACFPWSNQICHICTACGDNLCGIGENPCNCPSDCSQCAAGEVKTFVCQSGDEVPWCECGSDGTWDCINSPETQCSTHDCRHGDTCSKGYVCDPETGDCVVDCRMVNCGPNQNCIVCAEGEICDSETGLCVPDTTCVGEGETFESFQNENPCCAGLVPVPHHFPEDGTCVGPNCPCFICTKCGVDEGVCSLGENRCNCPEDCVTAWNCTANQCTQMPGQYVVSGTCPDIPNDSQMHPILQDGCKLEFGGLLVDLLGLEGCVDYDVIYTLKGCHGLVTVTGESRTMYFTCPRSNNNNTQESCTIFLDDLID